MDRGWPLVAAAAMGFAVGSRVNRQALDRYDLDVLRLNRELRRAIASGGELRLEYQPMASLATGRVVAVEALARWSHPSRGEIVPDVFVAAAERGDVIWPFTVRTLELAASQLEEWRRMGLDVPIAVNLSTVAMLDPRLPDELERILASRRVAATSIHVEITEGAIMAAPEIGVSVLAALADIGTNVIAIDDFGIGHSSLARLDALAPDALKIDRSFISRMAATGDDRMVNAVVRLGHSLGISVVAEGIEDEAVAARLRDLGCDVGQGYWLARPLPAADVVRWLAGREDWSRVTPAARIRRLERVVAREPGPQPREA